MSAVITSLFTTGISDPFSSLTHLLGAIAFGWLGASLVQKAEGDPVRRVAVVIFAFSCALMLFVSALFHMLPHGGVARPCGVALRRPPKT